MRIAVDDGVALEVEVTTGDPTRSAGTGPAVVLVHGLSSNLRLWDGVAAHLARLGRQVVAVDLRGHGRSDAPATGYSTPVAADDVAAVIAALGLDRPVVAGQSWGGNVALELAWRHPDRIGALALVDGGWIELADRFRSWDDCLAALAPPAFDGVRPDVLEAELRRRHPDWPESGIAGQLACYRTRPDGTVVPRLPRDRHLDVLRGLWEHRPSTRYGNIGVPVLLVPAGDGPATGGATATEVARAEAGLARCRTVWLAGDHDLHAQHPDRVARLLAELPALVAG